MRIRSKVWLEQKGELCFGAGRARILRAVKETGSLNKAAQELGMSYRHAWSSIRATEERLGRPLLIRQKGGRHGGGAKLTGFAGKLLLRYETLEKDVRTFVNERFREIFGRK